MPTYLFNGLSKSISEPFEKMNLTKDNNTSTANKENTVSIPLKQFQELIKTMELVGENLSKKEDNTIKPNNSKYSDVIHRNFCDGCQTKRHIQGVRYQCLTCEDLDLCEKCHFSLANNSDKNAFITHSLDKSVKHYDNHIVARIPINNLNVKEKINETPVQTLDDSKVKNKKIDGNTLEFDINDYNEDLFRFFEKFTNNGNYTLLDLKNKWEQYDDLLAKYEDLLKQTNVANKDNKDLTLSDSSESDTEGISVSFNIQDKNCIIFKVINDSKKYVIPKNASLHFQFGKSENDLTKCYLKLSEKESIQPGSLQIVRFNHMFNDYDILNNANYYAIKILNNDKKVLFENIINKTAAKPIEKELEVDEPTLIEEFSVIKTNNTLEKDSSENLADPFIDDDESYDILSEFDEDD
ncbi:hypothetical protein ACO0SA_003404 [Hanseniaspora valbyensis]